MKERTSKGDQPPSPSQVSAPSLGETYRRTLDQDWTISMLMELQKTVSGQQVTLNHVAENVTELKGTVRRIEKIIIGATAVVAVVGALLLCPAGLVALVPNMGPEPAIKLRSECHVNHVTTPVLTSCMAEAIWRSWLATNAASTSLCAVSMAAASFAF